MPYFNAARSDLSQASALAGPTPKQRSSEERTTPQRLPTLPRETYDSNHASSSSEAFDTSDKRSATTTLPLTSQPPPDLTTSVESAHSARSKKKKSARIEQGLKVHWARFLKKVGNGEEPDESLAAGSGTEHTSASNTWERRAADMELAEDDEEDTKSVNEVVVDRSWGRARTASESLSLDEEEGAERSTGTAHRRSSDNGGTSTGDRESIAPHSNGPWSAWQPLAIIRWRLWPAAIEFFSSRFHDQKAEEHYRKEIWFQSKPLALWSSLFFVINWVLGCALVPKPFTIADTIFYFGISPVLTLPIPFLVMFDFARDRPFIYHIFLIFSTWSWSFYQVIYIFACGYYSQKPIGHLSCGTKDFLSLFYYTSALQTIGLFGLKMNRFPAMLGAMVFLVMSASMVIPYRIGWIRNELNFIIFQTFLLYVHYMKEVGERRLFMLRDQLKMQFRATQKAQVNERRASESKRRLTSYVFHDKSRSFTVRVPLNTALIAVQNMEASQIIMKDQEVEFSALTGSLSMMSKVLNDVLDFNRMDSGLLESVSMPYALHSVMRSMFIPLQLATDARQLKFVTELDSSIDLVARRAAWDSLVAQDKLVIQDGINTFDKELEAHPDEDGIVVGDEMRLRQIVTNLVSNACKFTPAGGTLSVRTRLVTPSSSHEPSVNHGPRSHGDISVPSGAGTSGARPRSARSADVDLEKGEFPGLSAKSLDQHNASHRKGVMDKVIVRIEVSDTGYGIKARDITKGKLFSAFNQTEQGRLQGGKGTGLGLALVRHIVSLSGGRLGVHSKVGVGSTFWVELPLGVGKKAVGGTISSGLSDRDGPAMKSSRPRAHPVQIKSGSISTPNGTASTFVKSLGSSTTAVNKGSFGQASQTSSAMKGIMEQGGLVELGTSRVPDGEQSIPTRAIGDPSTGTDTGSLNGGPPSPTDHDYSNLQDLAQQMEGRNTSPPTSNGRPSYVELPKRPSFGSSGSPTSAAGQDIKNSSPRSFAFDPPLRVLVVDDDQLTRKLMKRMLTRLGCEVSTAENGQIAHELITGVGRTPASDLGDIPGQQATTGTPSQESASQRDYDGPRYELIFLDNQMPVLSGIDLVAKLRELGRRDFVVGVTGNALLSDQEEYQEAGVDYVITKPVFEVSLKSMLALAAERRKNGEPSPKPHDN